jgi:hypothetical protein
MPDITIYLPNIASGARLQPLDKDAPVRPWAFRKCPYPKGLYTFLVGHDGAAGGVRISALIGTTEVIQEGVASKSVADGVMPTPAGANATPAHQFYAEYQDEIILNVLETGAVATTDVMIWANVEPA